jgi:hypothetical protein
MAYTPKPPPPLNELPGGIEIATAADEYELKNGDPSSPAALRAANSPMTTVTAADKQAAETPPPSASSSSPAKQDTPSKSKLGGSWDTKLPDLFDPSKTDYRVNGAKLDRQSLPFMFEVQEPTNSPKGSNSVWQILLPFNPEGYRMVYAPRVSTTMTQGGIYEDNIGIAPPKFSINGVIGLVGTTAIGIGKSLEKEKKSGLQLYHEIEQGLLSFYERFGTYRMDGDKHTYEDATSITGITERYTPELRFYNFCDQEYWLVQINQFTLTRNTQRKHLYQYDIQITGLKRLGKAPKKELDLVIEMTKAAQIRNPEKPAKDVSAFESFMNGMKNITGKMGDLLKKVESLKNQMTQISTAVANFKNGLTELVHAPLDLVKTALETVESVISSINDIGNLPHEFLNDMRGVQRLLMSYQRRPDLFAVPTNSTSNVAMGNTEKSPADTTNTSVKKEILTTPVNLTSEAAQSFTTMNIPEETIFAAADSSQPVAAKQAVITDTDTIISIANKNGADWKQVAMLNDLEYPFIVSSIDQKLTPVLSYGYLNKNTVETDNIIYLSNIYPEPGQFLLVGGTTIVEVESVQYGQTTLTDIIGKAFLAGDVVSVHTGTQNVLMAGDVIAIPGTSSVATPIANTQASFEERLYGIDELLDGDGLQPDYGTGDIVVAKGLTNIEMQLDHRIRTLRGELAQLGHPEYGSLIPTFIGKMNTPVWQQRILIECQMTVLDDPRVDRLGNTAFTMDNSSVYFTADVYLKGQGNPLQISLPIA